MEFQDYYQTLGVTRGSTQDEIQKAYRSLARKFHPDINKEKGVEDKFKRINEAYEVLKDPDKRKQYDALGANWKAGQDFRPPPGWNQQQGGSFRAGGSPFEGGMDFSDFFSAMFGGGAGRQSFSFESGGGPFGGQAFDQGGFGGQGQGGENHEAEVTLTLEDLVRGGKKKISLRGSGGEVRTLDVSIPPGTAEGTVIRLAGQGGKGRGGKAGDLLLRVKVAPHPAFTLDGRDLITSLNIAPWEAVLGTKVNVPLLDGAITLNVPAGTQAGQRFRLKGKGLPMKSGRGDAFVEIKIVVPKSVTGSERELYEKMAEVSTFNPRA